MSANFYRAFEDKHRGSRELIKSRLRGYLSFIEPLKALYMDCKAVDLGCGRGEWLELLKEIGVDAHGVDLDDGMLAACRELGLSVETGEAVSYLKSLPDESQAVVSGFHVIEHIPFADLQIWVQEALRVLKPAGLLIMETPNPENIVVGTVNFYFDPTHLHPIPSQLLAFLPEHYGFYRTKILRLQEPPGLTTSKTPNLLDVLGGVSPDYAIVAQKNAQQEILTVFDHPFENEHGVTLETLALRYDAQAEAKAQQAAVELNEVRSELNGVQSELNAVRAELNAVQSDQNGVQSELNGVQSELNAVRAELNEVRADQNGVRSELNGVQSDLNGFRAELNEVRAELIGVYLSRSYKITAPLRAVFGTARIWRDRLMHPRKGGKINIDQPTKIVNNTAKMEPDMFAPLQPVAQGQSFSSEKSIIESFQNGFSPNQPHEAQEINLDEIMEKIRAEVARNKTQTQHMDDFGSGSLYETRLFRLIKRSQLILKKFPFYKQIYTIALKFKTRIPKYQQQQITVADLLKYDDETFIKNAYKAILKREPDSVGYNHFLSLLRTGSLSKTEILGRLRYSPEGTQTRVEIKGLPFKYFTSSILKTNRR
jgi:SAM-dependent methyltransferase